MKIYDDENMLSLCHAETRSSKCISHQILVYQTLLIITLILMEKKSQTKKQLDENYGVKNEKNILSKKKKNDKPYYQNQSLKI